jgi:hypothetical protein
MDLYNEFKKLFEMMRSNRKIYYRELYYPEFEKEEFLASEKLQISCDKIAERRIEDYRKSYQFDECPQCHRRFNIIQTDPLLFSGQVFEDTESDYYDCLDHFALKTDNMFTTNVGEWMVSEKVRRLMEGVGITGVSFEKVLIPDEDCQTFYQVKIHNRIDGPVYPELRIASEKCETCGLTSLYGDNLDCFNPVPFESSPIINITWKNWSTKYSKGKHADADVHYTQTVGSVEGTGTDTFRGPITIISQKLYKLFLENDIDNFDVDFIELV